MAPSRTVLLGLILAACGQADAFLAGPALPLHRGVASASISGRATLRSRNSGTGVCRLKAQLRPDDEKEMQLIGEALKDAVGKFNSGELSEDAGSAERPSWLPLLTLPLWAGLIGCALLLPSPEILEAAVDPAGDILNSVAGAAAGAMSQIPGMNTGGLSMEQLANKNLDPNLFVPVCKFSDNFYRTAKNAVYALAGPETYQEYAPLIAGSLLRVRLEFCVLESFVYESIIPFIKARGLSWVFPIKETLETFVAGVVFAVASNLVLIGSTKIITILVSYIDFFLGLPLRLIFGFTKDRLEQFEANKNPVGAVFFVGASAAKFVGQTSGVARRFIETADVFVGRYLLLSTVGYVILKFLKFKGVLTIESVTDFFSGLINIVQTVPPPT